MFRRASASAEDEGDGQSRPRTRSTRQSPASQKKDITERLMRILETPQQDELPQIPLLPPILMPATPPSPPPHDQSRATLNTSSYIDSPTASSASPTSPRHLFSPPTAFSRSVRQSHSIDSFQRRASLPLSSVAPVLPTIPSSYSPPDTPVPRVSTAPTAWDPTIADRLRNMTSTKLPSEYLSGTATDGGETETEWETDGGGLFIPHSQGMSSDTGLPYSSDDDVASDVRASSSSPKSKARLGLPTPRPHTLSNASSASSIGIVRTRGTSSPPPPVPTIPPEYASKLPKTDTVSKPKSREPHPRASAADDLVIAVIGASGCGKSSFVWKGMKSWGLDPHEAIQGYGGISVMARAAQLHVRSSHPQDRDHSPPSIVVTEPDRERRRQLRVTILELDTVHLIENAPPRSEIPFGDGLWAWPATLPKIDGVILCFDASDRTTTRGIADLCAGYEALRMPAIVVQCKSDLVKAVPTEHFAVMANDRTTGMIEASIYTEHGKKRAKDCFNWLIQSILRPPSSSQGKWRNPAYPAPNWLTIEDNHDVPPTPPPTTSEPTTRSVTPTLQHPYPSSYGSTRHHASHRSSGEQQSSSRPTSPARSPTPRASDATRHKRSTSDLVELAKRTNSVRFIGVRDPDQGLHSSAPTIVEAKGGDAARPTGLSSTMPRMSNERSLRHSLSMSDLRRDLVTQSENQSLPPPRQPAPAYAETGLTVSLLLPKPKPPNPMQFATFEEIIDKLTCIAVSEEDPLFIDAFLVTHRRFTSPRKVLRALHKRLIILSNETKDIPTARWAEMKIAGLLEKWAIDYPQDFTAPGPNAAMLDIIKGMLKRTYLLHYATDLFRRVKPLLNRRDPDASWTSPDPEDEYSGDTEGLADSRDPERKKRRSRRRRSTNVNIQVAVTTTTTTETDDELDEPSSSNRRQSIRSSVTAPNAKRNASVPSGTQNPKSAKRIRSASSFGILNLETLISPSKRMIEPLPPDAGPKAILRELNRAVDQFLKSKPQEVAEEITRTQAEFFLQIKPRDWLRHIYQSRGDDDEDDDSPRGPADMIDKLNIYFNRTISWTSSMILAPDAFMKRAKVAEKFISVGVALRKMNNYFGAHALVNGIRDVLPDGEILTLKVEESGNWKSFLSLEKLFRTSGSFAMYRMALRNSYGPVLVDLSVHIPDLGRMNVVPSTKDGDSSQLNWGKFVQLGRAVRHIDTYQKRFLDHSSHDFSERPFIKAFVENAPIMEEHMMNRRVSPVVPEDGSENPTTEKMKKFLGI